MTLRVAVVGSGPSGSSAAETLAASGIETYLFERKLDNAKPCGGAIPLCMVSEFDLPPQIIDRRVRKMKMISPSNREVDINLINEEEYIGMCRREVLDGFMRDRAARVEEPLAPSPEPPVVFDLQTTETGSDRLVPEVVPTQAVLPPAP